MSLVGALLDSVGKLQEPAASIAFVVIFAAMVTGQQAVERYLAPDERQDPRLGVAAFWAWVIVTGLATHLVSPLFDRGTWAERVLAVVGLVCWVAWKLGFLQEDRDRPREHEEIWASTVGVLAASFIR